MQMSEGSALQAEECARALRWGWGLQLQGARCVRNRESCGETGISVSGWGGRLLWKLWLLSVGWELLEGFETIKMRLCDRKPVTSWREGMVVWIRVVEVELVKNNKIYLGYNLKTEVGGLNVSVRERGQLRMTPRFLVWLLESLHWRFCGRKKDGKQFWWVLFWTCKDWDAIGGVASKEGCELSECQRH